MAAIVSKTSLDLPVNRDLKRVTSRLEMVRTFLMANMTGCFTVFNYTKKE